jgi:hypothetical protein
MSSTQDTFERLPAASCSPTFAAERTCHDCRYCGPKRGELIRCDHISWTHWDENSLRVFFPDFAPECDCFEPRRKPL